MSMFATKYGSFASARSYTIHDPNAPRPWCNVICNGRYGLVISHRGGGFSWFDDAQHNVLTRWEMDLVRDCYGKFLYVSDLATDAVWSAAPTPCLAPLQDYRCTHELGATTFSSLCNGIRTTWTLCVARDDAAEVWAVELHNAGTQTRSLRVSSYFEWTCGAAPDVKREFHRLFITTRHDARRRAILATKNMWDIPGVSEKDHWNIAWPHTAAHSVVGPFTRDLAIADKATFLGRYGTTASPKAMHAGEAASADEKSGNFGRFGDACAALGGDLTIGAGESVKLHYVIAIGKDDREVLEIVDRYADGDAPARAMAGARQLWSDTLSPTRVQSQWQEVDLLVNDWLPYQAISARLWGRTGYYQQSGAFGYRDQLQDSQVWLPLEPARCAAQIMLHAGRMFEDGSVNHWWHELANFGNHTECSDDYLWLAFVTASYLRETDDLTILGREAGFQKSERRSSLQDHCERAIERAFARMSPRGLPLIGSCDWNDGLSALGLGGKGESIWLAMFLCSILHEWEALYTRLGDHSKASKCQARRSGLSGAINQHAWDPKGYFRCATKDSGEWVGASSAREGAIHLNPQTWAILAQIGPRERQTQAWEAVKNHLMTDYGPLLLTPAYTVPDADIGYITRYSPGSRENGGVYMHAATWAIAAAASLRDRASVERLWKSIAPPVRGMNADGYSAEPYVLPGNVDGPQGEKPGNAGWTWYTGSAAWLRRVMQEWVLGVRPVWMAGGRTGLLIDPVVPSGLGTTVFERVWRGRRLEIRFDARGWNPGPALVRLEGVEVPKGILTMEQLTAQLGENSLRKLGQVHVEWR